MPERVWQELARGLMEKRPSRMFETLRDCGALAKILPEVDRLFGVPQPEKYHPEIDTGVHVMLVLDYAAARNYSLAVRFAALMHDLGKGTTPPEEWPRHIAHEERGVALVKTVCKRLRVPNDSSELGVMTAKHHGQAHQALEMRPATLLSLLQATDALRQGDRFESFLLACESDYCGRPGYADKPYLQAQRLREALKAASGIDAGAIAQQCSSPLQIKDQINAARLQAIQVRLGG